MANNYYVRALNVMGMTYKKERSLEFIKKELMKIITPNPPKGICYGLNFELNGGGVAVGTK